MVKIERISDKVFTVELDVKQSDRLAELAGWLNSNSASVLRTVIHVGFGVFLHLKNVGGDRNEDT